MVKTKLHFYKKKLMKKSASVILDLLGFYINL